MAHSKAVGEMLPGDHACLAYDTDGERDAILAAYVRDGLHAGHAVVCLVDGDPAESVAGRMFAKLGADGGDGRLIVVPVGAGIADAIGAAMCGGCTGVRVTAEATPSPR